MLESAAIYEEGVAKKLIVYLIHIDETACNFSISTFVRPAVSIANYKNFNWSFCSCLGDTVGFLLNKQQFVCFSQYFGWQVFCCRVFFGRFALDSRSATWETFTALICFFNSIHFCSTKFVSSIISKLIHFPFSDVIKLFSNHFAFNKAFACSLFW